MATRIPQAAPLGISSNRVGPLHVVLLVTTVLALIGAPWTDAFGFSLVALTLWVSCAVFLLLDRPGDPLAPGNTAVMLYAGAFALGPLWAYWRHAYNIPYLGIARTESLAYAAAVALSGFLAWVVGYVATSRSPRKALSAFWGHPAVAGTQRIRLLVCATLISVLGTVSYVVLIMKAGGVTRILNYSGGRADMFAGVFGGWFWGAHLIFAGYGMYAVALARTHPFVCVAAALWIALMFVPLQGRDVVLAPLFCGLIFLHRYRRSISWRTLFLGIVAALTLSAFVGAFRLSIKRSFFSHPIDFSIGFAYDLKEHLGIVVSENIEQLDMVMVAAKYVQRGGSHLGPLVLVNWAEPIDTKLLGNVIPSIYTGRFMDVLMYPEHVAANTAVSPSLVGELLIGLGWIGVLIGMGCYGAGIGWLTRWYSRSGGSPLLFAVYPIVVYFVIKMIVDGTVHLFRPLVVSSAAIACLFLFPRLWRESVPARAAE